MNDIENEATYFAMCLLMPAEWLLRDAKGIDVCDDKAIKVLAHKYKVPPSLMALRLGQLFERSM